MHQGESVVERTLTELLEEASIKASHGDLLGAIDSYDQAIGVDPSSASAWYGIGVMQAKRGNTADAVDAFEKAHALNPNHGATSANLAVLLEGSDSVRASEMARMALETVTDLEDLYRIASMHEADDEANSTSEVAVEEVPMLEAAAVEEEIPLLQSTPVLRDLGEVISEARDMLSDGAFQDVLDTIQPRLEGDASDSHELWSICGICLSQLGNDEEAIQAIEYAISIGEDEAKMHFNLAQLLRKAGREDNAMQSLANALLSDPAHVNSLIARGEVFADRGDNDLAMQNWRRVMAIDPENSVSERLLELEGEQVQAVESDDDVDEAQYEDHEDDDEVDNIESSVVETAAYKIAKAQDLTDSGDHVAAVNAWKELLQDDSQSARIWHGLADALAIAGHIERAQQCRQRAEYIENDEQEGLLETEAQSESDLIEAAMEAEERINARLPPSKEENVNVCIEWYNKCLSMLSEENGVEALNCFERAIGGAPREERELRIRAQNGRGHALYQLARYPESIQAYHAAISMDPAGVTGKSLYNMGSSYAAVELYSDAIKCFEQALGRGLDDDDVAICKTQVNRCKLLHKEQQKRQRQAT